MRYGRNISVANLVYSGLEDDKVAVSEEKLEILYQAL